MKAKISDPLNDEVLLDAEPQELRVGYGTRT